MKKYKHTKLGLEAEWSNQDDMYIIWFDNKGMKHFIDKRLIENSNDWEEVKEESKKPFFNPTPIPNPADKIKPKEEPNYLITAFTIKGTGAHRPIAKDGLYGYVEPFKTLEEMLEQGHEIYSVKNSKGIEWTLGDEYTFETGDLVHKITSFSILENELVINHETGRCSIDYIIKVKKPLYTTTDGKEIYEGDRVWLSLLNKDLIPTAKDSVLIGNFCLQDKEVADRYLTFTSEENRDKYIKENTKRFLFITKDGVKIYNGDTYYLCVGNIAETHTADENLDWTEEDNGIRFYDKEKALEYIKSNRKPIFVSADGKEMFEGDKYYVPQISTQGLTGTYLELITVNHDLYDNETLRFSTKSAAQEYIDNNKPKYSLADIEKAYESPQNSPLFKSIIKNLKALGK